MTAVDGRSVCHNRRCQRQLKDPVCTVGSPVDDQQLVTCLLSPSAWLSLLSAYFCEADCRLRSRHRRSKNASSWWHTSLSTISDINVTFNIGQQFSTSDWSARAFLSRRLMRCGADSVPVSGTFALYTYFHPHFRTFSFSHFICEHFRILYVPYPTNPKPFYTVEAGCENVKLHLTEFKHNNQK